MSLLDSSPAAELKERRHQWANLSLGEMARAVATRMRSVEVVTKRLNDDVVVLCEELKQTSPEAIRCIEEGARVYYEESEVGYTRRHAHPRPRPLRGLLDHRHAGRLVPMLHLWLGRHRHLGRPDQRPDLDRLAPPRRLAPRK